MAETKKLLIVGGGFTGLTAAYELSKGTDFSVTLVERSDHLGGLAAGFPLLGTSLEKTYHHLFTTDTAILGLVEELGLAGQLMWCDSSMGIYRGGRTYPFMTPVDLLRFAPCAWPGRLRVGLTALYLKHNRNWRGFASRRASEWMARACGRSAMDTIWTPLLKGKFDQYAESISMAWLWARINTRANSRPPGGTREQLGYFRGGFACVIERLQPELLRRQVRIQTGAAVSGFSLQERSALINGQKERFDFCVFTGPSPALAALLPADPQLQGYGQRLRQIQYLGAITLVFVSEQDIGRYYWLNINEPGAPFLIFVNHTRLVDKRLYQSKHVYYIGAYSPADSPLFSLSDEELTRRWWDYLRRIFPEFDPAQVQERYVFRFKAAQHIVDTQYEEKIPPYRTPLPGLFLANFSQIFPQDRGTNWAVSEGQKIAALIRKEADMR